MLNYELTMDDHLDYNLWIASLGKKQQKSSNLASGIGSVLLFVFGLLLLFAGESFLVMFGVWFLFMSLVLALGGPLFPLLAKYQRRKWKQTLEQNESMKHYQGVRRIAIEAEGLRATGPAGERMIRWSVMSHVATPTLDIFHVSPYDSIVVPRHAFKSELQRDGFLAEIERRRTGETTPPITASTTSGTWWTQGTSAIDDDRQSNTLRR